MHSLFRQDIEGEDTVNINIPTAQQAITHPLMELERLTFCVTTAYAMGDDQQAIAHAHRAEAIASCCLLSEQRSPSYTAHMNTQRVYCLKALIRSGGTWQSRWKLYELLLDSNSGQPEVWGRFWSLFFLGRFGNRRDDIRHGA